MGVDRPKRPGLHELLDEVDLLTTDANDELEAYMNFAEDLEEYCDEQEKRIEALAGAMGEDERREIGEAHASQLGELRQGIQNRDDTIRNMSLELAYLQTQLGAIRLVLR